MGLRETPKFTIVRALGLLRTALLDSGADLVAGGLLERADDVVHLRLDELDGDAGGWVGLVAERRLALDREARRHLVPRVVLGDGRTFYAGLGAPNDDPADGDTADGDTADGDTAGELRGSPVSPGRAEGLVRVVRDPGSERLHPGEVLVCAGTDPAWTPLFLTAAGLVTEVGGMLTHGSVVAREYGIPAVVGVHEATTRLRTGQRIRLDGGSGVIETLGALGSTDAYDDDACDDDICDDDTGQGPVDEGAGPGAPGT